MTSVKVTFTLDERTVARLRRTAERMSMPKSAAERLRLLRPLDDVGPAMPARPAAAVEREIGDVRRARRTGGRWGSEEA